MKTYSYGKQVIDQADIDSVISTLQSDFLTQGPKVKEFEDAICKYTGAKYAVAVSNGTAALHLAVLALGIGPGDSGITSPMTFVASANCLKYTGADVQFADIDPDTGLIDPKEIKKQITPATKVLILAHYAGQSCDMEAIAQIAKQHKLFVIEDAAHAIGSKYKGSKVGSCKYSNITTFSFHPVKTITTGEGGAITTNSQKTYKRLLMLRTHGIVQKPNVAPWYYEIHDLGYNYRLPDILASLGVSQLRKIDKFIAKRRQLVNLYRKGFSDDKRFRLLIEKPYSNATFHLFPLLVDYKKLGKTKIEIYNELKSKGLHLQVHYIPVHLQPYYRKFGFKRGDFPLSETHYQQALSLPLYPTLTPSDIITITKIIQNTIR